MRPRPRRAPYLRSETLPGEQAQVDWAYVGERAFPGRERALWIIVIGLGHSRAMWAEFVIDLTVHSLCHSLVRAVAALGGEPRQWLFDNPKTVVRERVATVEILRQDDRQQEPRFDGERVAPQAHRLTLSPRGPRSLARRTPGEAGADAVRERPAITGFTARTPGTRSSWKSNTAVRDRPPSRALQIRWICSLHWKHTRVDTHWTLHRWRHGGPGSWRGRLVGRVVDV